MADFEAFENPTEQQVTLEDDPAAEFLAREQDELKGLEDDGFAGDTGAPQGQGDGFDPFTGDQASGSPQQAEGDFFGGGAQENGGAPEADVTGGMGFGTEPATGDSGLLGFEGDQDLTGGPGDSYSAISQVDRQRQEPEKIRVWREENTRRIEKKDEEEEERKTEWREIAKKELDDWYKHHDEQLTKTKENNRASEEAFVAERDSIQPGQEWEKICRLCEFNPKNSKNTKDISRMRSVLLQLKQTPLVR